MHTPALKWWRPTFDGGRFRTRETFSFGGLGNSVAVWAVAAFLLTCYGRWQLPPAVARAVTMLVVAVPSYYVAAALIQDDDWSHAWNVIAWL